MSKGVQFHHWQNHTSNLGTPDWLDTGNNAWQLTAASLVALQSVPGLTVLVGPAMHNAIFRDRLQLGTPTMLSETC